MNATSHAMHLRNQVLPISVLVNDADSGKIPVRTTSIPPRATMRTIWNAAARIAMIPRMMMSRDPRPPAAGCVVRASKVSMFSPKHADPAAVTSHWSEPFRTQTENESAAATRRPTIVTPAPATTTSVSRLLTVSFPGSARCSHAIRAPPMITETIAAAPMYHQRLDCRKSTAPPALLGPAGSSPVTSALAPEMSTTAPRTRPTFPTAAIPSPARMRVAMSAPRITSEMIATTRLIHVT